MSLVLRADEDVLSCPDAWRRASACVATLLDPALSRVTSLFHGSGCAQPGQISKETSASDPQAGQRGTTNSSFFAGFAGGVLGLGASTIHV